MPYIKKEAPYDKLRRMLRGYADTTELAAAMGVCYQTARARMENPKHFTLEELENISRRLHIPIDEIRDAAFK